MREEQQENEKRTCTSTLSAGVQIRMARVRAAGALVVVTTFMALLHLIRLPLDQTFLNPPPACEYVVAPGGHTPTGLEASAAENKPCHLPITQVEILHTFNESSLMAEQELRQKRVADVCPQLPGIGFGYRLWRYKVDQKHHLIYCPIPKASWSSWKRVLFYINKVINSTDVEIGITPDREAGVIDMSVMGIQTLQRQEPPLYRPFTFLFVRNPWTRLVSAYINKALDWNYTRILHTPCKWETMTPYAASLTFTQFLTCIVASAGSPEGIDIHWTPMWKLCDLCHLRYDYIGHLETVEEDAQYIITKNSLNVTFPKIFPSRAYKAEDVTQEWYKSVPIDVIQGLRNLYKYDFLLHGYSDVPPGWENKLK